MPGAIIIEDGARLLPGFVQFLASGGYLHADLTQFCYGRARIWLWGGCDASPGVALRPLAASTGLASGYAVSQRGARKLLEAAARQTDDSVATADWPCDIAKLGALITRPKLVEPPEWLADAELAPVPVAAATPTRQPVGGFAREWRDVVAATLPASAAGTLRGFARNSLSRELSPGF